MTTTDAGVHTRPPPDLRALPPLRLFVASQAAARGTSSAGPTTSSPVLPAGLVSIMEHDDAPQVRAAAAGAAAALVKGAPLRKWMPSPPPPPPPRGAVVEATTSKGGAVLEQRVTAIRSGGGGGGGIGERVESMMLRLHRSLVVCLEREKVWCGVVWCVVVWERVPARRFFNVHLRWMLLNRGSGGVESG